jgi:hypothetical protein
MNDASWERITDGIDMKVGIDRHGSESRPLADRPELQERVEFIEFQQRGQSFRLERTTGPAIVDRKTHYSHRPGVANRVEYFYDPEETAHKVTLYRRQEEEWQPIELADLEL